MLDVREYILPDGRTFQLNEDDARRLKAKPINRSLKAISERAENPEKTAKVKK